MRSLSLHFLALLVSLKTSHGFASCRVAPRLSLGPKRPFRSNKEQFQRLSLTHLEAERDDSLQELSGSLASMLLPVSSLIDNVTDGWGMTYADLTPETHETPSGIVFLATNLAYSLVGVLLSLHGESLLGFLTECASVASFVYHFTQLKLGPDQPAVRLALLVDYIIAGAALLTGAIYVAFSPYDIPMEGLVVCALGVAFLGASWVWEEGMPYIIFHGMWHLFSAYGGYMIGLAHMATSTMA